MAYIKQTWKNLPDQTTPISAERLNHLETQYDSAVQWGGGFKGTIVDVSPSDLNGLAMVNAGVSGTTSGNYLNPDRSSQVSSLNPSVVFHAIGSNDWSLGIPPSVVSHNVEESMNRITSSGPILHVILHQHERMHLSSHSNYSWDDYKEELEILAHSRDDVLFLDGSASLKRAGVYMGGDNSWGLMSSDNVHLTSLGGRVLGDVFLSLLSVPSSKDSGWVTLNGWQSGWEHEFNPVKYRKVGNEVIMQGSLKPPSGFTGSNIVLNSLPEGFRPLSSLFFPSGSATPNTRAIRLRDDGTISVTQTEPISSWFSFDSVRFFLD